MQDPKDQPIVNENNETREKDISFKNASVIGEYILLSSSQRAAMHETRYYGYDYNIKDVKYTIIGEVISIGSNNGSITPYKVGDTVLAYASPIYASVEGDKYYYVVPMRDVIMWWS